MFHGLPAILFLHIVGIQGESVYRFVEERCILPCTRLYMTPNSTFHCDGDNSICDWQCAAQRMGCDEGLTYHCVQDFGNYELKRNRIEYIEACAPERSCNAGEEPYVTFSSDDVVRSHRNAKINCVPCADPNFYNSQAGKSSASYSRCYQHKFNKCIPEDNKINCGDISWRDRKETDGYCRCDARNGYAPENENVKTRCFYSVEYCVHKTCPHPAQELLLNYSCGDRCPSGMHRTEISDECVPNKLDQTTKHTSTIWVSQSSVSISTTTETIEVISTKRVDVKGNSDELYKDILLTLSIIVGVVAVLSSLSTVMFKHRNKIKHYTQQTLCQLKKAANIASEIGKTIVAGDPVQVTGDKPTIKNGLRSGQMEQHSNPVGSSQGIEITLLTQEHDATEEIPQEIEETSFSISRDQTFPRKDREIKDQSDSEKPLLLGHEKSPPLEKSDNTTTVTIESRDKNGDMNTASGQTSSSIAEPDESCELCICDKSDGLCNKNLQLIAQKCGGNSLFKADLELLADLDPFKALQVWCANITSENRNKQYKKLLDAVLATGEKKLYTQLKAKLFSNELQRPISEEIIEAKKLSRRVKPVYPYIIDICLNEDGTTAEDLDEKTNGQGTLSTKSKYGETNGKMHKKDKDQRMFYSTSTAADKVDKLRTSSCGQETFLTSGEDEKTDKLRIGAKSQARPCSMQ